MANYEIYDYLTTLTPDYSTTIFCNGIRKPHGIVIETGQKNVIIHRADDDSEERIGISTDTVFYVVLSWNAMSESDAGEIFDYYHSTSKASGNLNSFKWTHPTDGHTYVCRFDGPLQRQKKPGDIWGYAQVRLRILGKI